MTVKRIGMKSFARSALVALAMTSASTAVLAQNVVVEGNRRVDAETIRSYVVPRPGESLNLEAARQEMLKSGMFSDVRISRRGPRIVVSVRENESVNQVVFQGTSYVKKEQLALEVQTRSRGPYSQAMIDADVQRIKEVYRRAGRGAADVSARTVSLPNGRVDVVFTIKEGGKTGVKEIRFVGNSAFSSGRLRDLMTTTESNWLSWIKTSDVYDPDRVAADLELIRRYYLKRGYADFRVVSSDAQFDAARNGWIVTVVVEEGEQYKIGQVNVDARLRDVDSNQLQRKVRTSTGEVYNAEEVEKSLQDLTREVGSRGYAFGQVRPVGMRDPATRTVNITYVVEEGPRVYVERINVRGNTRTRDFVIRRELDLGEGDAYNKVLLDRAERRLNNTGYFKRVRITNEPGSAPDRVVVNIDVEDQPTGAFSIAGGYSTSEGFIGEVSVSESNFLGRGQFVRIAGQMGQYSQGIDFSFTEPFFLDRRMAAGFDLFSKFSDNTKYSRYENRMTGGQLRLGLPFDETLTLTLRYALYQQELKIPNRVEKPFNDCTVSLGDGITTINGNRFDPIAGYEYCLANGEASIALKEAAGTTLTSAPGYTLTYNTLDSTRTPRNGFYVELKQDFAGAGGDSKYIRTMGDARYYRELTDDVVGILRAQGGYIAGWGDSGVGSNNLRIVDNFFLGPSLVRGFAPSGIGPRDMNGDFRNNALGGSTYFGGSVEVQFPFYGMPRDLGMKLAVFADAGTLFGYKGRRFFDLNGNGVFDNCGPGGAAINNLAYAECVNVRDSKTIRSSVGASLLWNSPLGPIRFDYAYALTKDRFDQTQVFRFSGGTRF
jgi:outer membrane protein insertion porin family